MLENMAANSQSLNVVGLISGGKDSFYSILQCIANQHRIIALANLYPEGLTSSSVSTEDLNSYMYQTAGHSIVPLYAEALRLPLYRQEIRGIAANSSRDYHPGSSMDKPIDETESLLPLLKKVIVAHPTVNAVCSGAILSTYQRTRIESVARRLDLVPLSYLWQYPSLPPNSPGGLLDDMAAVGFDVRIVKVASGGLDEDLLWSNLMDPSVRRMVERSIARFGSSILGEGGEYETLVVDGPPAIWKGRIEVQNQEWCIGRGGGGEAWIEFRHGAGKVETRLDCKSTVDADWKTLIRPIELWDTQFKLLIGESKPTLGRNKAGTNGEQQSDVRNDFEPRDVISKNGSKLILANITAVGSGSSANKQMMGIKSKLFDILSDYAPCTADDIVFTTILLRSMTDFGTVNSVYERLFTLPNPPARVTIACGDALPDGVSLMVSFVLDFGRQTARDGLHVQSRSYWAPANIGPYSQAISIPSFGANGSSLVYVAGQIPLVPASMEVFQPGPIEERECIVSFDGKMFLERTCLALQHLWRIGRAMKVGWWTGGVAFITGRDDMQMKAEVAWEVWKRIHDRELWKEDEKYEDGFDIWDRVYGGMGSLVEHMAGIQPLPDFARFSDAASSDIPGFLAIEVDELPRGCDIEWQSLGIEYHDSVASTVANPVSFIEAETDQELRTKLLELYEGSKSRSMAEATVYATNAAMTNDFDVQIVPSRRVWGRRGLQLAGAIIVSHILEQ